MATLGATLSSVEFPGGEISTQKLAPTASFTISAGYAAMVPDVLELAEGVEVTIEDGGLVEIS